MTTLHMSDMSEAIRTKYKTTLIERAIPGVISGKYDTVTLEWKATSLYGLRFFGLPEDNIEVDSKRHLYECMWCHSAIGLKRLEEKGTCQNCGGPLGGLSHAINK